MTAGLEAEAAEQWLYAQLSSDPQLTPLIHGVFSETAPEGTPLPFVVYQQMSARDLMEIGGFRIWTNMVYLVKIVGQTSSYADLKTAVARIDAVLHRSSGQAFDGTICACIREQPFRQSEFDQGINYRSAGGLYRIYAG